MMDDWKPRWLPDFLLSLSMWRGVAIVLFWGVLLVTGLNTMAFWFGLGVDGP